MRGKLATVIDRIEHGHHVFRAYFKNALLKQYEKFSTFLRNELVSNNLADFRLKKGLDHLDAVRQRFQTITARFAGFQAQWLNVHVDFPLLQRLALPITIGAVRYPGIKIHNPRVIRLLEVLLHGGSHVGGWTAKQIHHAVLTAFHLSDSAYGLNQLRYDLRKLKGRSEEHTSELQSLTNLVCRLLLEKKKTKTKKRDLREANYDGHTVTIRQRILQEM